MKRKNRLLQICKWSAITLHILSLVYVLTQPWYFVTEEFRRLWFEKIGYLYETRITGMEAVKMLWNGFDTIGKYRYFSDIRGVYNMFLILCGFIAVFVCTEIHEIVRAFHNEISGWFLIGEVVMIYAELMIFQMLYNFTGESVEISEIMKYNYYIFACGLLPCIAFVFEVKSSSLNLSLSEKSEMPVSDIKIAQDEFEDDNEEVIEKPEEPDHSKCPGCGAEIKESWKYCQKCGYDLKNDNKKD